MNLPTVSLDELKSNLAQEERDGGATWLIDALKKEIASRSKADRRDSGDADNGERARRYGG